jgi:hypothetical protein
MKIEVGKTYESASGTHKKVTAIEGEEGKSKTVVATITKAGTGKGKHLPKGSETKNPLKAFEKWALREV